ncbi:MAG: hypothetical protein HY094_04795 [Candidatus Melainabacteria bacterium]|nr:hypothetical protein [Candidatus Melainabacteria bacterium]
MVSEEQKYRAEVFKILGIALMTPFGKLALELLSMGIKFSGQFLINFIGAVLLLFVGIMFIQIGFEEIRE